MGCHLAKERGISLEVESNNVELTQAFETTAWRTDIVVNDVTVFLNLKTRPNQVFTYICQQEMLLRRSMIEETSRMDVRIRVGSLKPFPIV